ncbi:MAG TPA: 16S rRNA (cytosine(1402)-N(4))-methyltransferase RsmH, partial [Verrucomicrobiae bacterium]|nr:16S rRNA (cytosine(1402)-N(4))-methyltransferase RsmH [Verrucomicrobiae bacterium]
MPSFAHQSVLVSEVLAALQPSPGRRYADGTAGGGGHAWAILRASGPDGSLFGLDCDSAAIEAARERLAEFAGRFQLARDNYANLARWLPPASCDGVLLDLGVSSPQLDWPERGFSFQHDGPLSMRMDQDPARTAAKLVNEAGEAELARIFWQYGDEPDGRRLARAIVKERTGRPFATTGQLAELAERVKRRGGGRTHPATRMFQALRIAVNDELGNLERGLAAAFTVLKPAGRLAVISFHSLEARMVKDFGARMTRDYEFDGEVDVP